MAVALPMKHIRRFVVLVASMMLWLVVLTFLNKVILHLDETFLLACALLLGLAQTLVLVRVLRF